MPNVAFHITSVRSDSELDAIRALFQAYADSLEIDLAYQDFESELAALPGKYAPPIGELLLAQNSNGKPLGCVAFRPLPLAGCCEMKRLYVAPEGRGLGLGRALVEAVLKAAQQLGYQEMRLDTLPSMAQAISLYRKAGFSPIEPYYDTPVPGTIFLARPLQESLKISV